MLSLLLATAPVRVHVEEGAHAEALARALAEEPNLVVSTASAAGALVSLRVDAGALILRVREADGTLALERNLDTQRGIDPALRMAVLLVRGAVEPLPVPPKNERAEEAPVVVALPVETGSVSPDSAWSIGLDAGVTTDVLHQLGFAAGGRATVDRWAFGASFYFSGWVAGSETSSVKSSITSFAVLADIAYLIFRTGSFEVSPFLAGGWAWVHVEARGGAAFQGEGTPSSSTLPTPVGIGGVELRYALFESVAFSLRLGARAAQSIEVELPPEFEAPQPEEPFRSNVFEPFAAFGASVKIF